jgi:hypothetical protein
VVVIILRRPNKRVCRRQAPPRGGVYMLSLSLTATNSAGPLPLSLSLSLSLPRGRKAPMAAGLAVGQGKHRATPPAAVHALMGLMAGRALRRCVRQRPPCEARVD